MMGFFTRADAKKKVEVVGDTPVQMLHDLGLEGVADMNRLAQHPCMEPSGDESPDIYILGDAPSEYDDEQGEHFVGKFGKFLRLAVPDEALVMWDYCVRTRTPKGRAPTAREIECFRPSVVKSIEQARPKIIIGVGNVPLTWALPGLPGGIKRARGRRFPIRVGNHECWFYPILHPAFVLRIEDKREDDIPGEEWKRFLELDVAAPFDDLKVLPPPCIESTKEEHVMGGVELLTDVDDIVAVLGEMKGLLAIDIETNCLRPYARRSRLLTISIASEEHCVAFPLVFGDAMPSSRISEVIEAVVSCLIDADGVIAHNLSFELEWLAVKLYPELARTVTWHDTMVQAYVLDHRAGTMSLDYCCREQLGFPIKSLSDLPVDALADCELMDVLRYNAIDAKYTHRLFTAQSCIISDLGLDDVYQLQMERVPTLVLTQMTGITIDQNAVKELSVKHTARLKELEDEAAQDDAVLEYEETYGTFEMGSTPAVITLFRDVLRRPEGKKGKGYSCDKFTLDKMSDEPLAVMVKEHRRLSKLESTYVAKFFESHEESYVHPDGKVHCQFQHTRTATGRTASSNPNNQNWPKRSDKSVRRMVVAPEGCSLVACDYGQIEARVLGMASNDEKFCDAIWNDLDVHKEWAQKIAEADSAVYLAHGRDMKKLRSEVKNKWVFPLFYGAGYKGCARALNLNKSTAYQLCDEFKAEFSGVFRWQKEVVDFYVENGYVECLTGRRRRGPLSYNQQINTPIQGTASDITVSAMNRISTLSQERELPWLHPALNVHDDITTVIPDDKLDEAIEMIVEIMVMPDFEWITVPVEVEIEVGKNWAEMEPVGQFSTKDFL